MPLSYRECQNRNIKRELRLYPATVVTLSSSSMAYLSLFLSVQLGLRLHPQVRRQLRQIDPDESLARSRPGQTLISFICLLPIAAGMAFPAVQTKYQGGGHGWGYGFSTILGYIFALWGHILYCSDLQVAVMLPPYV
ncbi:hypothetical protein GGI15_001063 [Coemansia interrupta]|uniref:Uncharacterized protein n=1 Tax=Coemansia interrupta TaxID=1126814 RepID=A0A9W8HM02_9FUNG|nr:hypothetical protein GGI15_001063 [Coemansia interrupta]